MSKRSSRRKRKAQQKKREARLTGPVLMKAGLTAFNKADYDEAITSWSHARKKPNAPNTLPNALAEAYFRRAVTSPNSAADDLQRATKLVPTDNCYCYHLALTHHKTGELKQAEPLYRQLLTQPQPYTRAAAPLAQLLIEQKKPIDKDPVWQLLNQEEQTQLTIIEALYKKKTASTLNKLVDKPLNPLWTGLIALVLKDTNTAQKKLRTFIDNTLQEQSIAQGLAHYYLGAIAAEAKQTEAALKSWQMAQTHGFNSQHLQKNLAMLAYQEAIQDYQAGHPKQAADKLAEFPNLTAPNNKTLNKFQYQLNFELGYAAAQKQNWQAALTYWEQAEEIDNDSRKLLFNLALAYQKTEDYYQATESWRTLLRRRPRKADHPDTLTNQQVARIWQTIAEDYNQLGDYDEAIKTYKNAVKWAPDNMDLRLRLVESYQSEGRWQASENELNRILEKEPDHIRALTLLAESYSQDFWTANRAKELWGRILELEPQNPVATQQLAYSYAEEARRASYWGGRENAINIFKEGLKQLPNNSLLLSMMGSTYLDQGKTDQARKYFEQAIAVNPNDIKMLHMIYLMWLDPYSAKDLQQIFEYMQAATPTIPGAIYIDLFEQCMDYDQEVEGRKLLTYAQKTYPNDIDLQVGIAVCYINLDEENTAVPILRSAIKKNPNHIDANIQLGVAYHYLDQARLAKRCWDKAKSQAQKENNQLVLHKIKMIKDELLYGKTISNNPFEMLQGLPPQVLEEMLKDAPPEIAAMFESMGSDMFDILADMAEEFDEDDEFFF